MGNDSYINLSLFSLPSPFPRLPLVNWIHFLKNKQTHFCRQFPNVRLTELSGECLPRHKFHVWASQEFLCPTVPRRAGIRYHLDGKEGKDEDVLRGFSAVTQTITRAALGNGLKLLHLIVNLLLFKEISQWKDFESHPSSSISFHVNLVYAFQCVVLITKKIYCKRVSLTFISLYFKWKFLLILREGTWGCAENVQVALQPSWLGQI